MILPNTKKMNIKKIIIPITFILLIFTQGVTAQESSEIDKILAQKRLHNKENPYGKGFKIQLYNGDETSAYRIKNEFNLKFDSKATLLYESPEWKVRVGNYSTRLEADRALLSIKEKFTGAVVLATEIEL